METNELVVKFNEFLTNPLFIAFIVLVQFAEFWKIFRENRFLSVFTFVGVLVVGCIFVLDLFLTITSEPKSHPFWHLVLLVIIFMLLLSYILIYLVERWGYWLTEKESIRRFAGPKWIAWLDVIYLGLACGALVKALNSSTFGVNPDKTIDKLAPLFLAAALAVRLTKAMIEIFELDKPRPSRWTSR